MSRATLRSAGGVLRDAMDTIGLDRLAPVRDGALIALAALYLLVATAHAWRAEPPPLFVVPVFVALAVGGPLTRRLHQARGTEGTASLRAGWPALIAPLVYFAEVRVVEMSPARYIDPWLAGLDGLLGLQVDGSPIWSAGGGLDELANLVYASYYLLPPLVLWPAHRDPDGLGIRATTALSFTTLACGVIWLVLPSGGYHPLGTPEEPGLGPFTWLVRSIYLSNPHFAAAFPSEHVAHAAAFAAVLRRGSVGRWVWLWVLGIALSTLVGQYHYAADALVGWWLGIAAGWVTLRVAGESSALRSTVSAH